MQNFTSEVVHHPESRVLKEKEINLVMILGATLRQIFASQSATLADLSLTNLWQSDCDGYKYCE